MTAELLVASPTTRPRDARALTVKVVEHLTRFCRRKDVAKPEATAEVSESPPDFERKDVPYLLAAAGFSGEPDPEKVAQFISRRIGVDPDMGEITRIFSHPAVTGELVLPVGARRQIAHAIDNLGGRSFRLEIEETSHE